MTKKTLLMLSIAGVLTAGASVVSAENINGWEISNSGSGIAEISAEYAYDGISSLHISGVGEDGDVTVSHPMNEIMHNQRIYRVTFYAKGEYTADNIQVGWGNKTSGNDLIINTLPVSHDKVDTNDAGDGWTKYSYLVKQQSGDNKVENNTNFTMTFKNASGDIYIDGISIVYDYSYDESKDADGYKAVGHDILPDGSFEDYVAGEDIEDYGWSIKTPNTNGLVAAADTTLETVAEVVYDENNCRSMYVKYNAFNNTDSGKALVLSKAVDIPDTVYVTLDVKGAYLPSSILIGGKNENSYQALVGGSGASYTNPYGSNVTTEKLGNGYTRYKVKTAAKGDRLNIKILGDCLGIYIDNISLSTDDGEVSIENGDFDTVAYDEEAAFAEGFENVSVNDRAFVQRVMLKDNWTVYMKNNVQTVGFMQKISVDSGIYTLTFDAFTMGGENNVTIGFADSIDSISGSRISNMESEDIGGGWKRYTAEIQKDGNNLIFASGSECSGIYFDNISLVNADGEEIIVNGDFELKTQPPAYKVGKLKLYKNGAEVTGISSGSHKAVVDVENNFCDDMDFTLIVCHVRDGKMLNYNKSKVNLASNGDEDIPTSLECAINISDCKEGDILEVYIWDNTENITSLSSYCVFNTL